MKQFSDVYEQQYAVALFNSVRFEIEGGGGTQSQLLHRKASSLSSDLPNGQNNKRHEETTKKENVHLQQNLLFMEPTCCNVTWNWISKNF